MKASTEAGQCESRTGWHKLKTGSLLKLSLPSHPTLLCAVRGTVERLTEVLGFPEADCRAVTRAVDEALANVVRHSYSGKVDRPIAIHFRQVERRSTRAVARGLEILICDRGPAIDPERLRGRSLEKVQPGGLGVHFIREAMDTVEFRRVGRTNRLRLVKYRLPDGPE